MIGNSIISVDQNCRYSDDDEVLRLYVAGRLAEPAAEQFEQHLFECDRCAEEVERAMELRAVMGRRAERRVFLPVAAAAIVAAVTRWSHPDVWLTASSQPHGKRFATRACIACRSSIRSA